MRKVTVPWWTRRDLNARPVTLGRKIGFEPILFLFETVFLIRLTQKVTALPAELRVHFLLLNQSSFATSLYHPSLHLSSVYFTLGTKNFWLIIPFKLCLLNLLLVPNLSRIMAYGRNEETWTLGLLNPIQALYQTELHPDVWVFSNPLMYCYYIILFILCQEDKD